MKNFEFPVRLNQILNIESSYKHVKISQNAIFITIVLNLGLS